MLRTISSLGAWGSLETLSFHAFFPSPLVVIHSLSLVQTDVPQGVHPLDATLSTGHYCGEHAAIARGA